MPSGTPLFVRAFEPPGWLLNALFIRGHTAGSFAEVSGIGEATIRHAIAGKPQRVQVYFGILDALIAIPEKDMSLLQPRNGFPGLPEGTTISTAAESA